LLEIPPATDAGPLPVVASPEQAVEAGDDVQLQLTPLFEAGAPVTRAWSLAGELVADMLFAVVLSVTMISLD
jgi:hypothetical protein